MIQLVNDRLRVEIATPGTLYRGSRFDWSTFITQVTLDGQHTFCTPESWEKGEGSGGIGLCNEFGMSDPIVYDSARPGEPFPKLGVGVLKRLNNQPYDFAQPYPLEPFPLTVTEDGAGTAIHFEFEPLPCRGFETRLKKTLRLQGNTLRIEYELGNIGTQDISTQEYNHNFLAINGAPPGPEYFLSLAKGLQLENLPSCLVQEEESIHWTSTLQSPQIYRTRNHLSHKTKGAIWKLYHKESGASVSETLNTPISRFALWIAPHVVSPEVFVNIEVKPGQTVMWTREYCFRTTP